MSWVDEREKKARYHLPGGYVAEGTVHLEHGSPALIVEEVVQSRLALLPNLAPVLSDQPGPIHTRRFRLCKVSEIRIYDYELMDEKGAP